MSLSHNESFMGPAQSRGGSQINKRDSKRKPQQGSDFNGNKLLDFALGSLWRLKPL